MIQGRIGDTLRKPWRYRVYCALLLVRNDPRHDRQLHPLRPTHLVPEGHGSGIVREDENVTLLDADPA